MNESSEEEALNEFLDEVMDIQNRWEKISVLNAGFYERLKDRTNDVLGNLQKLAEHRPDCSREGEEYESIFSEFKGIVEGLDSERKDLVRKMKDIAKSETYAELAEKDIELARRYIRKKELANSNLTPFISETEECITGRVHAYATFDKTQITESGQLAEKLGSYDVLVDELRKPTHIWKTSKRQLLITRAARTPRETDSLDGRQAEEHEVATLLICSRCGAEKKSGRNGLG